MLSRFRTAVTLALIAATSGSCATPSAADPSRFATAIQYRGSRHGYVFRSAYFTPSEEADPAWEQRRLIQVRQIRECQGHRTLRRDVRWYPATPRSGRRCAAIVYTIQCDDDDPARANTLAQDRLYLLRMDDDPPIDRDCGNKAAPERLLTTPSREAQLAVFHSARARCAGPDLRPAAPIRVVGETRIHGTARIHPAFARAPGYVLNPTHVEWIIQSNIDTGFWRAGLIPPRMRARSWAAPRARPRVANDGVNILVTLNYGVLASGQPYCVQLTARQGNRVWRRTIARRGFVEHLRRGTGMNERGELNDPARYWNPFIDANHLSGELGAYLAANADPVYAEGRPL